MPVSLHDFFLVLGSSALTAAAALLTKMVRPASSGSETQNSLNTSFKIFMDEANGKMARMDAELENCHRNHSECEERTQKLAGDVRGLTQYNVSLAALLRRHGIPIPKKDFESIALIITNKKD
jgi:hypothetical protein